MSVSLFAHDPAHHSSIRWSAIFAGLAVAAAVQVLLLSLGAAFGISIGAAMPDPEVWEGIGVGVVVWFVLASITSLFFGGLASGWIARSFSLRTAALHGVLVWCLATVAGVWLAGSSALLPGRTFVAGTGSAATENEREAQAAATAAFAWVTFLSMALGLCAATAGGISGFRGVSDEELEDFLESDVIVSDDELRPRDLH